MRSILVLLAALMLPSVASAEDCTFDDLHGKFTVTVDCSLLSNTSGNSQDHKRIWLSNAVNQLQIIESPEPYRNAELSVVMGAWGRSWGPRRTPQPIAETTFAGQPALVVTEVNRIFKSRTWILKLGDVNATVRAIANGKTVKERNANFEILAAAVEAGFKIK